MKLIEKLKIRVFNLIGYIIDIFEYNIKLPFSLQRTKSRTAASVEIDESGLVRSLQSLFLNVLPSSGLEIKTRIGNLNSIYLKINF